VNTLQKSCAKCGGDYTIALAGNPNVGKSTIFNRLTGLKQHTGNWPGKTVSCSSGRVNTPAGVINIVDTPGTYSLLSSSEEEEVARDYICFGDHDCVVVVADGTCLERNLNLVLQIAEATENLIVCVNLLDEATRKGISINEKKLSALLGVPVIGTSARSGRGIRELTEAALSARGKDRDFKIPYPASVERGIAEISALLDLPEHCRLPRRFLALKLIEGKKDIIDTASIETGEHLDTPEITAAVEDARAGIRAEFPDTALAEIIVRSVVDLAHSIYKKSTLYKKSYTILDRRLDKIFTSRTLGIPIMLALLFAVFWLTIVGSNYPSGWLSSAFGHLETAIRAGLEAVGSPPLLIGLLADGVARTLFWVISVMLPPMAIFFPLFTLLEDFGYLPRIAFNMDGFFARAGTCGKQSLTMCMGLGCNAVGVTGCRIIDSPRERLIAMLTNTFMPCNGRFPGMIAVSALLFSAAGFLGSVYTALALLTIIVAGVGVTLLSSKLLSMSLLKGVPSSFTLELPPYRKPDYLRVVYRSVFDRTLFVLGRAAAVAAPAGLVIWLLANIMVEENSLLCHIGAFLDPLGRLMGLDGYILLAFLFGFPANEIVLPIAMMCYTGAGAMVEAGSTAELLGIFSANGWTAMTAVCFIVFSLVHFPCSTTCLTIHKESGSLKWTALAFLLPTALGILLCCGIAGVWRLIAGF
jgi:ferrous iron transport protein B